MVDTTAGKEGFVFLAENAFNWKINATSFR